MSDLRYPIGRYVARTRSTEASRRAAIAVLAETPARLREAVSRLDDSQLDTPYRPGGWHVRQVVHHIPDSHLNAYIRFKLGLTEAEPRIKPYDEVRWAELPDSSGPIAVSLDLLTALHARWVTLLERVAEPDFARTVFHPELYAPADGSRGFRASRRGTTTPAILPVGMRDMTPTIPVTEELATDLAHLDLLRHAWSAGPPVPPEALARMRDAARIQSIAASCRIGGVRIREDLVASILRGDAAGAPETAEVVGYATAMEMPFPRGPVLVPEDLRRLNAVVLGDTSSDPMPVPYRESPLHLEAFDDEGRALGRVFQTLPPRLLPEKVDDLVTCLELELRSPERHPLLVIGTFILGCTAASPFERASGRTVRAAIVHLLRRQGFVHIPYASLEHAIEEEREGYYEAIDAAMTRFWSGEADLHPWLAFFLKALRPR